MTEATPFLPLEVFERPTRIQTVRRQLDEMERIWDFVRTLPDHDRERWITALTPLSTALHADLACQEGTGSLGALLTAGYRTEEGR